MEDLPEHVARNRAYWDELAERIRRGRPAELGKRGTDLGDLRRARGRGRTAAARDRRPRRDRARLRHRLRLRLAGPPRRPPGRDRQLRRQLATARAFQQEFGIEFPLLHGNAEEVPYPDASFDIAISEYGASIWCDPYAWIPEAARLLRPGGELVFLVNSILSILCGPDDETIPAGDELLRPLFGMHRVEWPDDDSVEFHLPQGKMIDLLARLRPRGERADRSPPARRRDHPLPPHRPRLGAPLPLRGSLARPQTRLTRACDKRCAADRPPQRGRTCRAPSVTTTGRRGSASC